ncbi:hypothetical protein NST63_27370 [Heyndrickxia sp. FSL W8-0496]|uniref:hypothetical protein n=1 Tax=Heyndrickxia TaxID=2837504 RepID=UPI001C0F0F88|nr:hypothetical protein [Heyndrickxia oleronia]MBU5214979.1 hypothetical protein [Heyndrickxia oleronia]
MDEKTKSTLLDLLKLDLGITHNLRDPYFNSILDSSYNEIITMGASLNLSNTDDQMLIVDFAAWNYRNRQENIPLSRSIQFRIHNRLIKKAGSADAITEA